MNQEKAADLKIRATRCEKLMSHTVEDGLAMIEAVQKDKCTCTIGSQRVSFDAVHRALYP